ncbi:MAG: DUF262 domain-containing HNH endonuclease family protein [Pseudomonadota bacterium]
MDIGSDHYTIQQLFTQNPVFRTPRYQRNYAWRSDEIQAFLRDLTLCLRSREQGKRRPHFLGSLVTVQARAGGRARHHCQVIDGQQRLATFVMLASQLRQTMEVEAARLQQAGDQDRASYLEQKAQLVKARYEWHKDEAGQKIQEVPRLELSLADEGFFAAMLAREPIGDERASHERLANAFGAIGAYVSGLLRDEDDAQTRVATLSAVDDVLAEDWTVILLDTDDRATAYMLFQVLNDRGVGLTEGELLRATTLERLESATSVQNLERIERAWHDIMSAPPERVDHCLRSVYASYRGELPGKTTLFNDLREQLFPSALVEPFEAEQAEQLISAIESLRTDMLRAASLQRGEWPVTPPVSDSWERERLRLLMVELKQTSCLPLLISAALLSEKRFRQVLALLEQFSFRYRVIVDAPRQPEQEMLLRHAVAARASPANYDVRTLRNDMRALIDTSASDDVFGERIGSLQYYRDGGNQILKYLLMTLEHYAAWYKDGGAGVPQCHDKSRIIDFATSTVEHIYPERANPADERLEPLLDTIGNLTILSAGENDEAGNKPYADKQPILARSTTQLNKWIAEAGEWTPERVEENRERLVQMALAVFAV